MDNQNMVSGNTRQYCFLCRQVYEFNKTEDQTYNEFLENDEQLDAYTVEENDQEEVEQDLEYEDDIFEFNFHDFNINTNVHNWSTNISAINRAPQCLFRQYP